jgi:hypothetical protein
MSVVAFFVAAYVTAGLLVLLVAVLALLAHISKRDWR